MSRGRRPTATSRRQYEQVGGRCVYGCGRAADHLHHVLPRSRGGTDALANRVPLCRPCGESQGSMTVVEWVLALAAELAAGCQPQMAVGPE